MMKNKIRLGVLFGGRSGEHEVSLMSARSVLSVLDPHKYDVTQIGITHSGRWLTGDNVLEALEENNTSQLVPVILIPEPGRNILYQIRKQDHDQVMVPYVELDVIFPVLHGTFGEDGTLQGMLEMNGIAYVGAGVLGSSLGMDKGVFKDIMNAHQIPVLNSLIVSRREIKNQMTRVLESSEQLCHYPIFTKPANLGSSVGITLCRSRSDLVEGLQEAAQFDRRVLIEQGLQDPREIEVSVLGNDDPIASVPGEIRPSDEFYSYRAKYIDNRSQFLIPADLPEDISRQIQQIAVEAYRAVDCAGMARADFLVDRESLQVYLNEINTIPGFTKISMYPKLWDASGLPYPALVDRLIELALDRKAENDETIREYRRTS